MHKRIFILSLGLIVLIAALAWQNWHVTKPHKKGYSIVSQPSIIHKAVSPSGNILISSMSGGGTGTMSSANYKITPVVVGVYSPTTNEEGKLPN